MSIAMRLYYKEVNRFNYKTFNTADLEKFKSMLKSNIKNLENIIEPTIEEMIDEDKAEELLPLIEHEIKVRSKEIGRASCRERV